MDSLAGNVCQESVDKVWEELVGRVEAVSPMLSEDVPELTESASAG